MRKTHLPVKIALLRPIASILLSQPERVDLVECTAASKAGRSQMSLKIIDFPGQSSFALYL